MKNKLIFGEDVKLYDMWRPHYPDRVFEEICSYANVCENSSIIEIGCGTGQATEPMLKRGYKIHAIEVSKSMCEYANNKFSNFPFVAENISFEDCEIMEKTVDLFMAATAFHWVDEEIGYTKMSTALKKNGSIALLWNRPFVARDNDRMHLEIQRIYRKYTERKDRDSNLKQIEDDWERYKRISNTIKKYGFKDVEFHMFRSVRKFDSRGYINLLNTYSDHRLMKEKCKNEFEDEIGNAIDSLGGILNVYDTVDLYLAKRS